MKKTQQVLAAIISLIIFFAGSAQAQVCTGDYTIDNKYKFEIGGKNKSFKQIKDEDNAYLVLDNLEVGDGSKIPLWLFGFLY